MPSAPPFWIRRVRQLGFGLLVLGVLVGLTVVASCKNVLLSKTTLTPNTATVISPGRHHYDMAVISFGIADGGLRIRKESWIHVSDGPSLGTSWAPFVLDSPSYGAWPIWIRDPDSSEYHFFFPLTLLVVAFGVLWPLWMIHVDRAERRQFEHRVPPGGNST